jgi:hypothetical protein
MGEAVVLAEAAVLESPWEIRLVWASVYYRGWGYTQPSVSMSVSPLEILWRWPSQLEMPWQCPSPLETLWRWPLPSVSQLKSRLPSQ